MSDDGAWGQGGAALRLDGVSFAYPDGRRVLDDASLRVEQGAFCLLVGDTGSGKTTLLRLCKPEVAPAGSLEGHVEAFGRDVRSLAPEESAALVGYVFQSPDSQIVCDSVAREMAFGLENLGVDVAEMRRRVAETCYFLGMGPWFRAHTAELSGGQRQLLALAATLVMRPRLLLLDEPTSMLDPVAEQGFLSALFRVNRELGVTVVVATHRPAAMLPYASCALRVGQGRVVPADLAGLAETPPEPPAPRADLAARPVALEARGAWLRYAREASWVLRGCDLAVRAGEVRALVGGNGSGKSTLLLVLASLLRPQHGRVRNDLAASQCLLPQDPEALLGAESVEEELMAWSGTVGYDRAQAWAMAAGLELLDAGVAPGPTGLSAAGQDAACGPVSPEARALLARNPLDLSGGQMQQLALAKLLLARPRLLLLDEPTKGLDDRARDAVARAIRAAAASGATVVVATHDMRLVRQAADTVSLLFDGEVTLTQDAAAFLDDSWVWRA